MCCLDVLMLMFVVGWTPCNQSVIQRHGFEQNLFSQLPWLITLLIFIKTTLSSIADNVSTFSLKHFKCNINIVYTAKTESSKTKISLFWNEKFTIGYQFYQLVKMIFSHLKCTYKLPSSLGLPQEFYQLLGDTDTVKKNYHMEWSVFRKFLGCWGYILECNAIN